MLTQCLQARSKANSQNPLQDDRVQRKMIVEKELVILRARVDVDVLHVGIEVGLVDQNFSELFDVLFA